MHRGAFLVDPAMKAVLTIRPPLPVDVYLRRPLSRLAFPLEDPNTRLLAARQGAVWSDLLAGVGPGDDVLVPAYPYTGAIAALRRSGVGLCTYEPDDSYEPVAEQLEALLAPSVRALYLFHFLGFPQDVRRWRAWCDERGLLLIEDARQAWLASSDGVRIGSSADIALFDLHETLGIPDVTALRAVRADSPSLDGGPSAADIAAGSEGALGHPRAAPSRLTAFLVRRLADPAIAAQRRSNYRILLEELRSIVPPPFDALDDGASPLVFPILLGRQGAVERRLRERGIQIARPFRAGHGPARSAGRNLPMIGLPVHQELRPRHLDGIVRAVRGVSAHRRLRLDPVANLDTLREEWNELAVPTGNIFSTWEWLSTWWRYFGDGHELWLTTCRTPDERLVAILPLYRWPVTGLRVLRFLGHDASDELGPICAPADRLRAGQALRSALDARRGEWDLFLAERMPGQEPWTRLLDGRLLRRQGSPVLRFGGGSWDSFLATRSANLRQQVRRKERQLAASYDVRFRLAGDDDRLDEDMDTLFALHGARWSAGHSSFSAMEGFHREFAAMALERGWLRLWFLELDRRAVAAWYGFRIGGVEAYYQAGRDARFDRRSVGFVLLAHTIRAAFEDGVHEYRFLRGDEGYKYRFTDTDPGVETVGVFGSARGAAAVLAAATLGESDPIRTVVRRWRAG